MMGYIFSGDSCFENPQKFLIFNIHGPHDIIITDVRKFMHGDTDFVVEGECKRCGKTFKRHFVDYNELRNIGFTREQLKRADDFFGVEIDDEHPDKYNKS